MLNDPSMAIPFNSNSNLKVAIPKELNEASNMNLLNENSALAQLPENPSNNNLQFLKNVSPMNGYSPGEFNSYS